MSVCHILDTLDDKLTAQGRSVEAGPRTPFGLSFYGTPTDMTNGRVGLCLLSLAASAAWTASPRDIVEQNQGRGGSRLHPRTARRAGGSPRQG